MQKPTSSSPPPPTAQQKASVLFNQAIQATRQGKLAQAEKLYRQMLEQDPKATVGWMNLALLLGQQKRHDEAIATAQKAVRLEPKEGLYKATLASLEWNAGRTDEAIVSAKEALAVAPKSLDALRTLGGALVSQKRFADAVPYLKTWAELQPKDPAPLGALATIQVQAKLPTDALVTLRTMTKRFPKEANAFLMRADLAGRLATERKDKKLFLEARDSYSRAFTLNPKNLQAGYNAAVSADQAGEHSEALMLLEKLRERFPNAAMVRHSLALAYLRDTRRTPGDRVALGLKEAEAAVGREPKNPDYAATLGYMVLSQGSSKELGQRAAKVFEGALKLDPKNIRAKQGLAESYLVQSEWEKALPLLKEQLAAQPDDDTLRHRLAATLQAAGRRSEAAVELRTIAKRNPKDTKTLKDLARLFEQDGQPDEAEKTLEEARQRDPQDLETQLAQAGLATRRKQYEKALLAYNAVLAKQPANADAHAGLIGVYDAQENKTEALAARERWVKADPKNNQARYELGLLYSNQGRDDDALRMLRSLTLRQGDPNRDLYRQALPEFYRRKNRFAEEASELRHLTTEEPTNDAFRLRLAEALERAGKPSEAEETYKTLIARAPTNDLRYNLALIGLHERTGKVDQAIQELEELIAIRTSSVEARTQLIRMRKEQKRPELAVDFFEKVALSEAGQPNILLCRALDELCQELKLPERYLAFTQKSLEVYPKSNLAWKRRGQSLDAAKRYSESVAAFEKAGELDTRDPEAPFLLGRLQEAQGKKAEAIAAYTASIKRQRTDPAVDALKRLGAPVPK
ncbi:tetratricopeptide repeat protein [Armatimonas rosea]|uniref:Tetratricopeptide (TPR) repeat protein n=1 Tax=Armatimonas rosea TaxID=685828 RepID=A0A7W9W942_ARMRO|nr:tetratricopeptide repeat protein [Armatimonas rosea]MBB6052247.1 tetratricopeptide (TPR) repeat protein [Armatimonas rosea]